MGSLRNTLYTALRRSESFFKADMVYLAKGGFWQTVGQAASGLFSFVLLLGFANLLPKESYGVYRYILSLASVLTIFTFTGMNRSVIQAVASGHDGALKTAVRYQLKWSSLLLAAFWGLGVYYFLNGNIQMGAGMFILGFSSPLVLSFNTYGAYLEGKKEFGLNNIFSAISVAIYVGGMLITLFLSEEVPWLVFTYAATTLSSTLLFYFLTLKMVKPLNHDSGEVLDYGRKLTFIGMIAPISSQIDNLVVTHFWGASALAAYSVAMALPSRATTFVKSFVDLGFPKLVARTPEEIERVYFKRIFHGLAVGTICALGYIAVAPYIFTYLLPQYIDSLFYSQMLAFALVTAIPNRYHSTLFESQKLSKLILTNNIIHNVFKIVLYLFLGFWGGIIGLVAAHVINSVVSLFINMTMWRMRGIIYR